MKKTLNILLFVIVITTLVLLFTIPTYAATKINAVSAIGVSLPIEGETVSDYIANIKVPSDAKYRIITAAWINDTDNVYASKFESGKDYFLYVDLEPLTGYEFDRSSITFLLNNSTQYVNISDSEIMSDGTVRIISKIYKPDKPISSVKINNFRLPVVATQVKDYNYTVISGSKYSISQVKWYDYTNNKFMSSNDYFEAGREYMLYVYVEAVGNYSFIRKTTFDFGGFDGASDYVNTRSCSVSAAGKTVQILSKRITVPYAIMNVGVLTYRTPAVNETAFAASKNIIVPSDANYKITNVTWKNYTDGGTMKNTDSFQAGKEYHLIITLAPKEGYMIAEGTMFTINNGIDFVDRTYSKVWSDGTAKLYSVSVTPLQYIDKITINDFETPAAGATAEDKYPRISAYSKYRISSCYWYNVTDSVKLGPDDTFKENKTYVLYMNFDPVSGYCFNQYVELELNGSGDTSDYITSSSIFVPYDRKQAKFSTAQIQSKDETVIGIRLVNLLGFRLPEAGDRAGDFIDLTVPATAGYSIEQIYWYDNDTSYIMSDDDVFESGSTYFIHVNLKADAGYEFLDYLQFAFDGSEEYVDLDWSEKRSNTAAIIYSFDYTIKDAGKIPYVQINGLNLPVAGLTTENNIGYLYVDKSCDGFYAERYKWVDTETSRILGATDEFISGKTYRLVVELKAYDGYAFDNDTEFYIDDEQDYVDLRRSIVKNSTSATLTSVDFTPSELIKVIDLFGFELPKAEDKVADFVNIKVEEDCGYRIVDVYWYNITDSYTMKPEDIFESDKWYWIGVNVVPEEGYLLSDELTFTYDGSFEYADLENSYTEGYGKSAVLYSIDIYFGEEPEENIVEKIEINGYAKPVIGDKAGKHVSLTTPKDCGYYIDSAVWVNISDDKVLSENDVFVNGKEYYLKVNVKADDGYMFSKATVIDIGTSANVISFDADTLSFSTSITSLVEVLVTRIEITNFKTPVIGEPVGNYVNLSTLSTDSYDAFSCEWYCYTDGDKLLTKDDVFEENKEYYLCIRVITCQGFDFDEEVEYYINNSKKNVDYNKTELTGNNEAYIYTTLVQTESQVVLPECEINGHDYVANEVPASCTSEGYIVYTCSRCGSSYTDIVPPVGHIASNDLEGDEDGHWSVCAVCGTSMSVPEPHTPMSETEDEDGRLTCALCGISYTKGGTHVDPTNPTDSTEPVEPGQKKSKAWIIILIIVLILLIAAAIITIILVNKNKEQQVQTQNGEGENTEGSGEPVEGETTEAVEESSEPAETETPETAEESSDTETEEPVEKTETESQK